MFRGPWLDGFTPVQIERTVHTFTPAPWNPILIHGESRFSFVLGKLHIVSTCFTTVLTPLQSLIPCLMTCLAAAVQVLGQTAFILPTTLFYDGCHVTLLPYRVNYSLKSDRTNCNPLRKSSTFTMSLVDSVCHVSSPVAISRPKVVAMQHPAPDVPPCSRCTDRCAAFPVPTRPHFSICFYTYHN